mgnify:CR=1 FL=1
MKKLKRIMLKTTAPRKGFTLIEMVIVLAIIALLMLIVVPNLNAQRENASKRQSEALQEIVYNQAEMYHNEHPEVPGKVTIETLKDNQYLNEKQALEAKNFETVRPNESITQTSSGKPA